jgi:hypothetical protein
MLYKQNPIESDKHNKWKNNINFLEQFIIAINFSLCMDFLKAERSKC